MCVCVSDKAFVEYTEIFLYVGIDNWLYKAK